MLVLPREGGGGILTPPPGSGGQPARRRERHLAARTQARSYRRGANARSDSAGQDARLHGRQGCLPLRGRATGLLFLRIDVAGLLDGPQQAPTEISRYQITSPAKYRN